VRADTTAEKLAKLQPAFKVGGTVTAGNASPFSDGARGARAHEAVESDALGLKPLARFVTFAAAGVDPDIMGVGPIKQCRRRCASRACHLADIDVIEFNEAFAAQIVASVRDLGMQEDRVNVNGGAIALDIRSEQRAPSWRPNSFTSSAAAVADAGS
jgi:acetyl-CoA acyltransferase